MNEQFFLLAEEKQMHIVNAALEVFSRNDKFNSITDFFELTEYISKQKMLILAKNPYIMDFIVRSYYSQSESVSVDTNTSLQDKMSGIFSEYLSKIDFSKFRDDLNPMDIFNMLFWLTDGYMHDKRSKGLPIILEEIVDEYGKWSNLIKRSAYKEECL